MSQPRRFPHELLAHARALARVAAGPLVFVGFFLPWAKGPGLLAATDFTGFKLVQFAGRLQLLELPVVVGSSLLGIRLLILMVAVAAAWLTVLAPLHRWHTAYWLSGWYLTVLAGLAVAIGLAKSGVTVPPAGLALWLLGVLAFLANEFPRPPRTQSVDAEAACLEGPAVQTKGGGPAGSRLGGESRRQLHSCRGSDKSQTPNADGPTARR